MNNNEFQIVGLYNHNANNYEVINNKLKEEDILAIIQATGTGKSYLFLQLAYDNKDKKILYVAPSNSIIEHIKEIINGNSKLSLERDFPNLEFRTYQSLINMSEEELSGLDINILVLDEFHHIGAPVWGSRIDTIVGTHSNMKVIGMTAYTVRNRGTSYERDMTDSDTNELFSGKVVSRYDLCDALIDGVLPKPIYKSGYVFLEKTAEALERKLEMLDHTSKDYKELSPILKTIKKRIHEAPSIKDIFKTNIKRDGKYIYFCPLDGESGRSDINSVMEEAKIWIHEMGLSEDNYELYISTSDMGDIGKSNRLAFYNDEDLSGNKVDNKLRIMFCINQYNEGVHAPGLDGVIMGRATNSDIVFFEQLGRALSVRGKTREEYDKLYSKSIEELLNICRLRDISIKSNESKEEIIEKILAPIVIDLTNNIGFIKNLENNLKDRVKDIQSEGVGTKRKIYLGNTSFDISMQNEDLFKVLEYMSNRLIMTWMDKYELAKKYYEHYGNLEIPEKFKTIDGITCDENGISLGRWIYQQRLAYQREKGTKLDNEQIKLLESIGMQFETNMFEQKWNKKYELAKKYYEYYGNLEIPEKFKTIDGITYDENGVALGAWISNQRSSYRGKGNTKLTEKQIRLLESIGMRFETNMFEQKWNKKYELAKKYYEHYGNLEISKNFKTKDGITYDENGIFLGQWIPEQRKAYNGKGICNLTEKQIKLLESIGMRFETNYKEIEWNKKYELAKKYYEHYGNLEIHGEFKTKDGITYDENGVALGAWISNQRSSYRGKGNTKLTEEQIKLLESIGMRFEANYDENEWNKKYELAKIYYEHYGNLEISQNFKTKDGITYDESGILLGVWINNQRMAYKGKKGTKLSTEQIKLLESIGMRFETNYKEMEWNKKYELARIYYEHYGNLEISQKFKTKDGITYDENGVALGVWISNQRMAYKGKGNNNLTEEQVRLLDDIGMIWISDKVDDKLQSEEIKDNSSRKKIEILNRFRSYLGKVDGIDKEELNKGFMDELDRKNVKK